MEQKMKSILLGSSITLIVLLGLGLVGAAVYDTIGGSGSTAAGTPTSITSNLNLNSNRITNVGDPQANSDVATRGWVQTQLASAGGSPGSWSCNLVATYGGASTCPAGKNLITGGAWGSNHGCLLGHMPSGGSPGSWNAVTSGCAYYYTYAYCCS